MGYIVNEKITIARRSRVAFRATEARSPLSSQYMISPISRNSLVKHFELLETSGCDISGIREEFYSRRGKLGAATCFLRARDPIVGL